MAWAELLHLVLKINGNEVSMINIAEVKETNDMIEKENLDVRTITLGISLLNCLLKCERLLKPQSPAIVSMVSSVVKSFVRAFIRR